MRFDTSIHVHFQTDQLLARLIERHDGQPLWSEPLTLEDVNDKAEEAASVEKIRHAIEQIDAELKESEEMDSAAREALEVKRARLAEQLKTAEEEFKEKEAADKDPEIP